MATSYASYERRAGQHFMYRDEHHLISTLHFRNIEELTLEKLRASKEGSSPIGLPNVRIFAGSALYSRAVECCNKGLTKQSLGKKKVKFRLVLVK